MFKMIPWSSELDLTEFYAEANQRGFVNNSSQKMLVDSLAKESKWCVWILYYNNRAVGSVGAHSLPELDKKAYRICVRTCAFTDLMPFHSLRTKEGITTHQNVTAQFFIPKCIEWVGDNDMYITTHPGEIGRQRLVHNIWGPNLEKTGVLTKTIEKEYRGHIQTFWKINSQEFLRQLNLYGKWA
jgi:hypothetical protein